MWNEKGLKYISLKQTCHCQLCPHVCYHAISVHQFQVICVEKVQFKIQAFAKKEQPLIFFVTMIVGQTHFVLGCRVCLLLQQDIHDSRLLKDGCEE